MTQERSVPKKGLSADWLVRGVLTRIGDTVDRFTGRRWTPSSSIATSELVERIKKLLDAEAKDVQGKGIVVPHNIKLRMQWDRFSSDAESALAALENELLVATVDHINDSLYYTYAPVTMDVKPDYFIQGVKLMVSFEQFTEEDRDVEMNVTVPAMDVSSILAALAEPDPVGPEFLARFQLKGEAKETSLKFPSGQSLSVGRTGGNDLILDDASVSKTHASLAYNAAGHLSVADTGSTNGTFVNDERIAYGKAIELSTSDKVRFGTVEVAFELIAMPIAQPESPVAEDEPSGETVEIDGFEFRGREGPESSQETDDQSEAEGEPVTVTSGAPAAPLTADNETETNITVARSAEQDDDEAPETVTSLTE